MAQKGFSFEGNSGKEYFEKNYIRLEKESVLESAEEDKDEGPKYVNSQVINRAQKLLVDKAGVFLCLRDSDYYLLDGAVIYLKTDESGPESVRIVHETDIGVAYVVNKLELPSDGPRFS
jgi:hypothetical protein